MNLTPQESDVEPVVFTDHREFSQRLALPQFCADYADGENLLILYRATLLFVAVGK